MPVSLVRLLPFALLATPASLAAQRMTVERGWPLDAEGAVRVFNTSGPVRVIGWDRDSVAVTATLASGEAVRGGGSRTGVKMFVEMPDESKPGGSALVVRVPLRARVWVKGANDAVHASGVAGGLDLYTVGGRVEVEGSPSELRVEAMQGDVVLAVSSPWLRAKTASGAITLRGSAEDAGLESVSGRLDATLTSARRVRLESVTGDVRLTGAVDRDGSVTVETHSGTVELALPRTAGFDYEITTIAAPIENGVNAQRPRPSRVRGGSELYTSTAGGGAQVVVRSFKGRVVLRAR
jgi:hypothetical protein